MTTVQGSIAHPRLRAPADHGQSLIHPPYPDVVGMLAANRANLAARDHSVADQTLAQLALTAREDLLQQAIHYTAQYRDLSTVLDGTPLADDDREGSTGMPLILSGHQPQLFHPGVWFKNFALHRLGQAHQAIAINLLIDIDLLPRTTIRVPTGTPTSPRLIDIPFDRPDGKSGAGVPFEMWPIHDRTTFDRFPQEVNRQLEALVADPVVNQLWPAARQAADRGKPLGACLAEARHQLEGSWGLKTLEVPLSKLCDTPSFHRFVLDILGDLPRFVPIFNSTLHAFRQVHHIRSHSHPVPELEQTGGWLEAPFWLFSDETPQRQKLWVRHTGTEFHLRAGEGSTCYQISANPDRIHDALQQLTQLRQQGVRLRSRVLTTTMYARLFLSDLFLHGIGGSNYDQLTDAIIEQFWDCDPPNYMTLTATMKLPLVEHPVTDDDVQHIDDLLRQLWYQPDRHLDMLPNREPHLDHLLRKKRQLVNNRPRTGSCLSWHQQLEATNHELRACVQDVRQSLHAERQRLALRARRDQLLGSREFSFCLFPGKTLRQTLENLSRG